MMIVEMRVLKDEYVLDIQYSKDICRIDTIEINGLEVEDGYVIPEKHQKNINMWLNYNIGLKLREVPAGIH